MLFVIEERKGDAWALYRVCKDQDDATKGVAAMLTCRPGWPVRVSEYARVDSQRWFLQFENTPPHDGQPASWRNYERDGYPTKEAALADLPESQSVFRVPHRVVCESFARDVVETFPAKASA